MADSSKPKRKRGRPRVFSTPAKKQRDREKFGSRVFLLDAFPEWRKLRERLGLKTDCRLAQLLLDSFKQRNVPRTSSPRALSQSQTPSLFGDESSVESKSDDETIEKGNVGLEVREDPVVVNFATIPSATPQATSTLPTRGPENVLENIRARQQDETFAPTPSAPSQTRSLCTSTLPTRGPENEAEINALENIRISVQLDDDSEDEWDDSSSEEDEDYIDDLDNDPDYVPPATLRSASTLLGDIEQLEIITPEEEVFCHDMGVGEEDSGMASEEEVSIEEADVPADTRYPGELKILRPEDIVEERCAIIYNRNLRQLVDFLQLPANMQKCRVQSCTSSGPPEPAVHFVGSGMVVKWHCRNGHLIWRWFSQPRLKYGLQGGDFMQASSVLLSGNNYSKFSLLCKFMNLGCVNVSTFHKIQMQYCVPTSDAYWEEKQDEVIRVLRNKEEVILLGDGRMDSPGYCAQYCTYTAIDNQTKSIVAVEVIDKRETNRKSTTMEKEGFKRTMDKLLGVGVPVTEVCTDAHPQISALMNQDKGEYGTRGVHHSLDVWHGAKNLTKKIVAAGQVKGCTEIKPWTKDIVNHFWWCCKKGRNYEEFIVLWKGVLHHVCDEHTWATGSCHHEHLSTTEPRTKSWLAPGSAAHKKLSTVVLNKRFLKTASKYLRFRTTSDLESFQNHILMYASKRHAYSPPVYRARCQLAAIDYNAHKDRAVWKTKDGHIKYKRRFQKKSERWSVHVPKQPKTYSYIQDHAGCHCEHKNPVWLRYEQNPATF
ncbi:uncharacterized protein LOC144911212 [Branchiostoma floridae x Branchiostoma belcheri]